LQEPPIKIVERFFFSLSTGQKIFFHIEFHLETLEIKQEFFFEQLPRVDASRREPRILVSCSVLKRDDERFGEDQFIPSSRGCGIFVAHKESVGVDVSMVF
jgi:hypothetical protein